MASGNGVTDMGPLGQDSMPAEDHQLRVPGQKTAPKNNEQDQGVSSTDVTAADTANSTQLESGNPTTGSPSCLSSWSSSSDRQLGYGAQQDPADRVFPIRSVISLDPAGRSSGEQERFSRRVSVSESHGSPLSPRAMTWTGNGVAAGRQHSSMHLDAAARRATSLTDNSVTSNSQRGPASSTPLVRTQRTQMSGSRSSVQADAERYGSTAPIPLMISDSSDEASDSGGENRGIDRVLSSAGFSTDTESTHDAHYTHRFKHVVTEDGHAVITGRDGKLQRCEDEPIHTPGAVQAFGVMVAIQEDEEGRFQVHFVSENSNRILGYTPQQLFRLNSFLDILTEEQAENLLDHIDFIRDEDADPSINGPEVFSLSIRPRGGGRSFKLWCAIHVNPANPELVVCEFEMDNDVDYPLRPADEEVLETPEDTIQSNPTTEELTESTEILSKPLRILRTARKRRGEAGAMQVFDIMSQVQEQLANATTLEMFLKILVGIVKELTGFHRVMIYQFDSSFNGKVVTELVDPTQAKDLFKGLHFPASDIPRQARELYKINKVRLLYDRGQETARIVCRSTEDLEKPLDMTHAYLRAMSPIHIKYLANMAVRSSMSISINAFGDLWGLIACHSYGSKGMRVSFPIRKMCRLVGDTVSRNIERLSYASRLQARKLINTVPTDKNPSGYIIASSDDLLKLFDADFGMLSIREETKILGKIEHSQEALVMLEYLRLRKFTSVVTTQDICVDFPDLRYPPGFSVIAGLLYVPLSVGGNDFIVFFRKGQVREVKWAGNPHEKVIREGTASYLEPRSSFKVWHETVLGKSRDWSEEQIETAAVLCLVYGKFIEVWRQKEAALQNSRLTRLLLANSAHEVRTPLNAIINYLEIALEGSLDQETRDNLARSHSASKSLIYVINDLLDLTKTEEGKDLIKDELFDLTACIREATEPFKNDARRKSIKYEVIEHEGLPKYVCGDQRRVRQAVANVMANAVQHTTEGFVRVELYVVEVQDRRVRIEIVVQDSGEGMSDTQLDALFRELEQVDTELDDELGPTEDHETTKKKKESGKTLGLGLAVVSRILRNMDGQLRLKSELGKGSRFVIQLPFDLPEETPGSEAGEGAGGGARSEISATGSATASVPSTVPPKDQEGEVLLVDHRSSVTASSLGLSPKRSFEETGSIASKGSRGSGRSDADRLIGAIQMSLSLGEAESENTARQRRDSRGAYYKPGSGGSVGLGIEQTVMPMSPTGQRGRPDDPLKSMSSPGHKNLPKKRMPSEPAATPGMQYITDSKVPIKPVRIPDDYQKQPELPQQSTTSKVLFEIPDKKLEKPTPAKENKPVGLQVLVAEDDPINVKVLKKRLEKAGHKVAHALNGEDCATMYEELPGGYDVVLMDMQMPIVDGLSSTKMIRAFEKSERYPTNPTLTATSRSKTNRHRQVPIFAVSASLVERELDTYVDAGFDGWILKPIDFKRLETLLRGIVDDGVRDESVYVPGEWERGGWFKSTATEAGEQSAAEGAR